MVGRDAQLAHTLCVTPFGCRHKERVTMIRLTTLLWLFASFSYSQDLVVGVIEQNFHNWDVDTSHPFVVRVAFKKDAGLWRSFPTDFSPPDSGRSSYPAALSWTICFDGRNRGSISSSLPERIEYYKDIGIHYIDILDKVPMIGKPGMDFAGWIGKPVYRPLVVCTSPNCADPEKWKPYRPTTGDISKVLGSVDSNVIKTVHPVRRETYQVRKSFASRSEKLICVSFVSRAAASGDTLDGPGDDSDNNSLAWFVLRNGSCQYLRSDMLLLDAGDYDNDGKSEVVFKFEEYDRDGYVLYYDDFRGKAEFGWIYH